VSSVINLKLSMLEDRDLVARVANGDIRAFEAIYDRHSAQVFGLAMRVTSCQRGAEEATQDAFVNLWRTADSYDPRRGALKTWLLAVVRNRSIDWLRREARHTLDVENNDAMLGRVEAPERTDDQAVTREEARHARQLLVSIPTEQRQIIELAYFKGLTQSEIAVKIGIPLGTVKGRPRLGLTKMHQQLTTLPESVLSR
jgi:RNA polymerase sigma-70 factor (ECF subfamily)